MEILFSWEFDMKAKATAYVSTHCPNCTRLVDIVRSSKLATAEVRVVDIDTLADDVRNKLAAVPTIQTPNTTLVVGSEAFTYLQKYEGDRELDGHCLWGIGVGGVMFSDYERGDGIPQTVGAFHAFEPLPE